MHDLDYNNEEMQEGMGSLFSGYIDYSKSVIIYRALPDLRDGLKPVNRCSAFVYYGLKDKGNIKCQKACGLVLDYHPHGADSVYSAQALLTDRNRTMFVPILKGHGAFGDVCTDTKPAAMRYTEAQISDDALKYYFQDMCGISMIPNYNSTAKMPEVLPVSFPAVLCNSQEGIAVGFRGKMPSFNLIDVLNLTKEYINNGKCSTVILPDFVTGGYYIQNHKELSKLMSIGTAKLKLRGRIEVVDKNIIIYEFPYGKTLDGIKKQIDDKELPYIKSASDANEMAKGVRLIVECTAKNRVDEVIYSLYKNTDLQYTFSADLTCVLDSAPLTVGVWGIIEQWVKWRRTVLTRAYTSYLSGSKEDIKLTSAFIELLKYPDKKHEFIRLITQVSKEDAVKYLLDNFDNEIITYDLAHWLSRRRLDELRTGGKHKDAYDELESRIKYLEHAIENIDEVICSQLDEMIASKSAYHVRRTEITSKDYNFTVTEEEKEVYVDTATCYYAIKDNFLRKYRYEHSVPAGLGFIEASASAVLVGVDNRGRVIRIYCKDINYTTNNEMGTYIPTYLDLNETDDYAILYLDVLDGSKKLVLYKDGYVGVLDTSEWMDCKKQVRVIERGVDNTSAHLIAGIEDFNETDWLYACDNKGRLSYVAMTMVKQMNRTARKKVFEVKKDCFIYSYSVLPKVEGYAMLKDISEYGGSRMKYLKSQADLVGDVSKFKLSF